MRQITSPSNPLVRQIAALQRKKARSSTGLSVVEGFEIARLAMMAGRIPEHVLYYPLRMDKGDWDLIGQAEGLGARCIQVSSRVLGRLSQREGPLGCVATVPVVRGGVDDLTLSSRPLVVVAEGLEKPGNLGALIRTASAAGADAFIVADARTDVYSPACIHASLGAVFVIPVAEVTSVECARWLAAAGISVITTTPYGVLLYDEVDMTGPTAIVIGNEHSGVQSTWLTAGRGVQIPMKGPMNSLNATTAGGIVLFEAVRQRRAHAFPDAEGPRDRREPLRPDT